MNSAGPPDAVLEQWEAFVDDVEATADQYRDEGWSVLELHPGDVTPQPGSHDRRFDGSTGGGEGRDERQTDESDLERVGFDVLVPDDEFENLEDLVDAGFEVTRYELYRGDGDASAFALVVELDESTQQAVLVPLYYQPSDVATLSRLADERGELETHVRPLSRRRVIAFSHREPETFFGEN